MIDKHHFPKDYDFQIVNEGVDFRSSMLRSGRQRRRSSATQRFEQRQRAERKDSLTQDSKMKEAPYVAAENRPASSNANDPPSRMEMLESSTELSPEKTENDIIEGLTGAFSSLKFVPPSIRFGRRSGKGRGGFSKT